jgi:hypothetical protein
MAGCRHRLKVVETAVPQDGFDRLDAGRVDFVDGVN